MTILKKSAEKKINEKCSECKDKATAILDRIPYCSYHHRLKKYPLTW